MASTPASSDWDLIPKQIGSFDAAVLVAVVELRRKIKPRWIEKDLEFLADPDAAKVARRVMGPQFRGGSRHWQHVVAALGRLRSNGLINSYYAGVRSSSTQRYLATSEGRELAVSQYGAKPRDE